MELISRQAVLDGIDKYIEKAQSTGTKDDFISFAELGVKALPSAFEGMTNEEVMKAVFGKSYADIDSYIYGSKDVEVKQWCRSPYKGVSE